MKKNKILKELGERKKHLQELIKLIDEEIIKKIYNRENDKRNK